MDTFPKKPRLKDDNEWWTQLVSFNSEDGGWDSQIYLLAWGTLVTFLLPEVDYNA